MKKILVLCVPLMPLPIVEAQFTISTTIYGGVSALTMKMEQAMKMAKAKA